MKFEVELSDSDLQNIAKKYVLQEISKATYGWKMEEAIKAEVAKRLPLAIADMVQENMKDLESMRDAVSEEIQRKLKAQISAVMKKAGQ